MEISQAEQILGPLRKKSYESGINDAKRKRPKRYATCEDKNEKLVKPMCEAYLKGYDSVKGGRRKTRRLKSKKRKTQKRN